MIVQHPSTPDHMIRPETPAESVLSEAMPELLEIMMEHGFNCEGDTFKRDFRIVVELLRAVLYGQLGIEHELQSGLGKNNPIPPGT